jgi:GNAT superfamily N-acetyltransferase
VSEIVVQTGRGDVAGRALEHFTADEAAEALEASFEGYFVPMRMNGEAFERRFRAEHVDRRESRIYRCGTEVAGLILVARRGAVSRIAAMGCAQKFRRCGLGAAMLDGALSAARARGDARVTLEVLEPNYPARALYSRLGFHPFRTLVGYVRDGERRSKGAVLSECDGPEYAEALARQRLASLPWTLSSATAAGQVRPDSFFHLNAESFVWLGPVSDDDLTIRFLFTDRGHRGKGSATALLAALEGRFPNRQWAIPPVLPEGMGANFLRRSGFSPQALRQIEMVSTG